MLSTLLCLGQAKCTYIQGHIFKGSYVNDNMHGHGKYTYANGSIYEGVWVKGLCEGMFKITRTNGTVEDICYSNGYVV